MAKKSAVTQLIVEVYTDGDQNEALTSHFNTLRIINSIRSPWPIFEFYVSADNQMVIEKNMYGASDIQIKIWYSGQEGEKQGNPVTFDLIYMESNLDLPPKYEHNGIYEDQEEGQRRQILFKCLSKPAVQTMTAYVNRLWEEEVAIRPIDLIKELLVLNDIEYRIFEDGVNENKVSQVLVPPMTMKSATDYINEKYGIFSGPMFRYANYAGQFCMWDLKKMYEAYKNIGFTRHHKYPSYIETEGLFEEINDLVIDLDDNFATYDMVQSLHYANSNVLKYGYDNTYIYHPHEDIAYFVKKNLDEIVTDYGIWHDSDKLKYNTILKNRKIYYSDMKGFETGDGYSGEYSDHSLTSDMSNSFKDAASIKFTLYRNVKIHLCQKVGEVLYLKPYSDHEKFPGSNYEGGYLVSDSEIILTRVQRGGQEDNMNCIAFLTGYRTVQSKD